MSAVWSLSRAAARRRRLQTVIIGFVAFVSAGMLVLALGLLSASSAPFEHALNGQRGAELVATFNRAKATDARLAATARRPGVNASAGPFPEVVVDVSQPASSGTSLFPPVPPGPLALVGRASPTETVDDVKLWRGSGPPGPARSSSTGLRAVSPPSWARP